MSALFLTRRQFLLQSAVASATVSRADDRTRFAPFDKLMASFLAEHEVPGGSLAVSRNGSLVYTRGFGLANVDKKLPVEADSLFRIASISKPITAAAVLQLVDANKVKLDEPVLNYIRLKPHLATGTKVDPRWYLITVRHCLQHTGGWDRDKSGDPIGMTRQIAAALGTKPAAEPEDVVRFAMGRPLDFDPGTRFAYSNLGYLLLGRVIETATGRGYEESVKKEVLAPLGITRMQLGRALPEHRARGEVNYYDSRNSTGECLYLPRIGDRVPFPDGATNIEGYEAHGGWIASAPDLVKFACAFDVPALCPILSRAAIQTMWERPSGGFAWDAKVWYGCGWSVRPQGEKWANTWHSGLISGTSTLLVRRSDGWNWAVLFNTERNPAGKFPSNLIDPLLHNAVNEVIAAS